MEAGPDSSLHVAFFSGGEGQPGCSIAYCRLSPGGAAFTPCRVVSSRPAFSAQNPVLFYDTPARALRLFHTSQGTGPGGGENTSAIWTLESGDLGTTWSPPAPFFTVPGAFTRNKVVVRADGSNLLPCYYSVQGTDSSFMLASNPARTAWAPLPMPSTGDLIQPTVVRPDPARPAVLRAWLRDEDAIAIYTAVSLDEGGTWSLPQRTALPNNNAGIAAATLSSGAIVMAYNNHSGTDLPRSPLVVSLSEDGGLSWPFTRVLAVHDENATSVGEYSYPSATQMPSGEVVVSYTYDRQTIVVRLFNESWVRQAGAQ